jgi:hypothetical protein
LISRTAVWITVSVFRPRKSNFTSPAFSTSFIANCVTISPFCPRKHGTYSQSGLLADHDAGGVHAGVRLSPSSDAAMSSSCRCTGLSL